MAMTVSRLAGVSANVARTLFASGRGLVNVSDGVSASSSRDYTTDLRQRLAELVPEQQERIKALKKEHGTKVIGDVTVNMALGGMRGIKGLLWETSLLDVNEGIRFRGYSIPDIQEKLPKAVGGTAPLPEGLFWLLVTGELPDQAQVQTLSNDLKSRMWLPPHVMKVLDALPDDTHPMTQLSTAVMAMQTESKFAAAYQRGIHKSKYWEVIFEDTLDLVAKLPIAAALIYRRVYRHGKYISPNPELDWAANYAHMMGYDNNEVHDLFRLYMTIHSDHEGGNVSAHTGHLVASALSDPYLSYSAALNGLAGPLHGLANQEVLGWLNNIVKELGPNPTKNELTDYVWATLKAGKVVPGFGHAVLRKTDPRYTCQREFALENLPDYNMFKLVSNLYEVVPAVLTETGKVQNPWPNVDAHSGVLLQYYGINEENYYTVMFGVSRALGVLAQGAWSRALGMPIERPKSLTMDLLEKTVKDMP